MAQDSDAVSAAVEELQSHSLGIPTSEFSEVMADLINTGMAPAEARYFAASALSDASYREIGEAFGVTKGSIGSSAGDTRRTIRNARQQFVRFVDGPKRILSNVTFGNGGFSDKTTHYVFRYLGNSRSDRPDAEYGVIKISYAGQYNDPQCFEDFVLNRYDNLDSLVDDYYEEQVFEDIRDAYAIWSALDTEGFNGSLANPDELLNLNGANKCLRSGGMLYAFAERTDSLNRMESWDGPIEYDDELVSVVMGHSGTNSFSIRAESGAEISHFENEEYAPDLATLYKEVGPIR